MKDIEREQQEIVKKYLQHRQLMRQSENAMTKAALDTKMLQDANDRVFEVSTMTVHFVCRRQCLNWKFLLL